MLQQSQPVFKASSCGECFIAPFAVIVVRIALILRGHCLVMLNGLA